MKPSVGRIVHYVSYGTPGGEYISECRAAVIAEVVDREPWRKLANDDALAATQERCVLQVINPRGIFFDECVHNEGKTPGTWHWPEREPEDDVEVGAVNMKLSFHLTPDERREVFTATGGGLITDFARDATLRRARELNSMGSSPPAGSGGSDA